VIKNILAKKAKKAKKVVKLELSRGLIYPFFSRQC